MARTGPVAGGREGTIVLAQVRSRAEGGARTIRVYLPPGLQSTGARYPVLILQDGQNLFARAHAGHGASWRVDESLDELVSSGQIPPWIVVGVDHAGADRIGDFSPWPDARRVFEPRAHRYASFLVEDLAPWIDTHLPAQSGAEARAIGGSSLGGLVSLYVAWLHPSRFGRIAAFSPSVMWSGERLFDELAAKLPGEHRIWLDAGEHELLDTGSFRLDYGDAVRRFGEHLRALRYGPDELRVVLEPGGAHDEASWGRRFPDAMRWLVAGGERGA